MMNQKDVVAQDLIEYPSLNVVHCVAFGIDRFSFLVNNSSNHTLEHRFLHRLSPS